MLQETFRNQATKQILTQQLHLQLPTAFPRKQRRKRNDWHVDFEASAIQVLPKQVMKILQIFP
jgi:hypothetical protein